MQAVPYPKIGTEPDDQERIETGRSRRDEWLVGSEISIPGGSLLFAGTSHSCSGEQAAPHDPAVRPTGE